MPQYVFHCNQEGSVLYREVHRTSPYPVIQADPLVWVTDNPEIGELDQATLAAVFVDGQVVGVAVNPDYTPPEPAPDPVQARLEALEVAVKTNVLASPHDRRWLEQKEEAKSFGIPWLREHPDANQADLESAVLDRLGSVYAGQPIVVSPGIIMSYADEAAKRGYTPDASFASLKALIQGATDAQLQAMLRVL